MLGWRRRNDGFDWHKYVRTTIKLRREDRRRRVVDAGEAAKRGVAQGAQAAVSGVERLAGGVFEALAHGARRMATTADHALRRAGRGIGSGLSPLGRWSKSGYAAVTDVLATQRARLVLVVMGAVAVAWGLARYRAAGLDREATWAFVAAGAVFLAGVMPYLGRYVLEPAWRGLSVLFEAIGGVADRLPVPKRFKGAPLSAALGGGVVVLVAAGGYLGLQKLGVGMALPRFSMMSAPEVQGRVSVLAGDSVRMGDRTIMLAGIEAPDKEQRCTRSGNRRWKCGEAAAEALRDKIRSRALTCQPEGTDSAGRTLARCTAGGEDIAAAMVREGHVFSSGGLFARYGSQESEARQKKAGVWAGDAERPGEWRAKRWEEAKKKSPSGCPIKGQVTPSGKVYLMPGAADYERARVRTSRGERWFCSEDEARTAGFKVADRG